MMEAMRRLDEWQEMIQGLGSFDTIYRNRVATVSTDVSEYQLENVHLPAAARVKIYELLDGTHSLREVISEALRAGIASRLETFVYLHALQQNELVKPMDFRTLLGEAKKALGSGDVPAAAKYIRAILGRKEKLDLNLIKRYLEFLKKYQRPRLAFDEARRFAAQSLATNDTETAITLYEEAIALDRNPEVIDRLFYALLRANRRDRAVDVGLLLRDFLGSEAQLQVAARVAKNLDELAPDNPEVIELTGLILKRQERNEEAAARLERALAAMELEHPRRAHVVKAILELQPDRHDLRDEQASLELQQAQAQLRREKRRRWAFVGGTLLGVILLWRGYAEFQARAILSQAREAEEAPLSNKLLQLKRLSSLLQDVPGGTLVSGAASDWKQQVDEEWDRLLVTDATRRAQERAEQVELAELQKREAQRKAELRRFEDAITIYRGLVGQQNFAEASARALALTAEYATNQQPVIQQGLEEARVFTLVLSSPDGAEVFVDGTLIGRTPVAVPVRPRQPGRARLRLQGYRVVELPLSGDGYDAKELTLEPGPSWRVPVGGAPLTPVVWRDGVVVALPDGRLRALSRLDGSVSWDVVVLQEQPGAVVGLAAVGERHVAVLKGAAMALVELSTGQLEWERDLPGGDAFQAPAAGIVGTQRVIAVAGERTVVLLDGASGTPLQRLRLPAPAVFPPTVGARAGDLPLKDRLVALDPSGESRALLWQRKGAAPTLPLVYSHTDRAVLLVEGARITSLAAADGALVAVLAPQVGTISGATLINERLYALGKNGLLSVLRSSDGLELTPARPVIRSVGGGPVTVGDEVHLVDARGTMLRVTLSGRTRPETVELGAPVTRPLVALDRRLVCVLGEEVALIEPVE